MNRTNARERVTRRSPDEVRISRLPGLLRRRPVGPGGVFTVNTKHHPKATIWVGGNTFMVDGHKTPYIRNSRHEVTRAAELLTTARGFPVHVDGLIVTVNAADITVKAPPDGVHVVPRMQLAKWVLRQGNIHTTDTIQAIYDAVRRSTTWQP